MGVHPHQADPSRGQRTAASEPGDSREQRMAASEPGADERRVPEPLPQDNRKWSGAAMLLLLAGLAVIALVILL